ncbi:MAG: peptide-N-glycosidase F-related protein [Planctomycetota bacterium]
MFHRQITVVLSLLVVAFTLGSFEPLRAQSAATHHPVRYAAGTGPRLHDGTHHLLDEARTAQQLNAVGFDVEHDGAFERSTLRCKLRVTEGGDGGSFLFLNTAEFGKRGPAPFLKSAVEANLAGSFAVGVDVHNPPSSEPFGPWGNYQNLPEREISLHFDGRELVKRVAPVEFRGETVEVEITLAHVTGGAEVTVRMAGGLVYDRYFIAELLPYEARLGIVAGTRGDVQTIFDVSEIDLSVGEPARPRRAPLHVEVFHHVMTNNQKTAYEAEVELPPLDWAFGRVILTLDIHDGGLLWDEWDRNGEISLWDAEGVKRGVVPFITSYRTACHWKVDVTHFRPYLTGKTKFEIRAGTTFYKGRGYAMSVSLDFYHGTPELEPFAVTPLWNGTARYQSEENHFQDFFEPQSVEIPASATAARLFSTTTGHSQIGEFTPSRRAIIFEPQAGEAQRFENTLWKTDCYLNPNRPQFGTWKYSRAGWAPGDIVWPWWVDLTPHVEPGNSAVVRYEPEPYDFSKADAKPEPGQIHQASHVVRSYLIYYRPATATTPAPIVRITNVAGDSNAQKAGLRAGDYLAQYDGQTLDSVADLRAALQSAVAADKKTISVVIYRGTDRLVIEMPTGRMGVNLSDR